jgi:hypothetical protein
MTPQDKQPRLADELERIAAAIQSALDADPEPDHENCCGTTDQCCQWGGDIRSLAARARRMEALPGADHPEACTSCGRNITWSVASPVWNKTVRGDEPLSEMLCPICFVVEYEKRFGEVCWTLSIEDDPPVCIRCHEAMGGES